MTVGSARAPHRAALLCDLEYLRDGGDFIPLAQPRNEQAKLTAELCLSAQPRRAWMRWKPRTTRVGSRGARMVDGGTRRREAGATSAA